jgi:hypothetical protein
MQIQVAKDEAQVGMDIDKLFQPSSHLIVLRRPYVQSGQNIR